MHGFRNFLRHSKSLSWWNTVRSQTQHVSRNVAKCIGCIGSPVRTYSLCSPIAVSPWDLFPSHHTWLSWAPILVSLDWRRMTGSCSVNRISVLTNGWQTSLQQPEHKKVNAIRGDSQFNRWGGVKYLGPNMKVYCMKGLILFMSEYAVQGFQ